MSEAILAAEKAVLGALLLAPERMGDIEALLGQRDFSAKAHGFVFKALLDVAASKAPIDYISVGEALEKAGRFKAVGGTEFLLECSQAVVSPAHIIHHAIAVREAAARRRAASEAAAAASSAESGRAVEAREHLQAAVAELELDDPRLAPSVAADVVDAVLSDWDRPPEIHNTGIEALDTRLGGFELGDLFVVAAGTGGGKTALAAQIALHISRSKPVLYVTLEMNPWQINCRLLGALSGLDTARIRRHDPEVRERVEDASAELRTRDIRILRGFGMTPDRLRAATRSAKGTALLILDHMHLMRVPGSAKAYERMVQISSSLKDIAVECNVALMALAQLNRQRDGRPRMDMLRDSGSIEQDADQVVMLWQGPTEEPMQVGDGYVALEAWVEKNRHGAGSQRVSLDWHKPSNRITSATFERNLAANTKPGPRTERIL